MVERGIYNLQPNKLESHRQITVSERIAERHPEWPNLKVKFYFSSHVTAEDMEGVEKHISDADIYLYELTSEQKGKNETTEFLQEVSNSNYDLSYTEIFYITGMRWGDKRIKGSFMEPIVRSLSGTQIVVGHIDLRAEHNGLVNAYKNRKERLLAVNFDTTLKNLNNRYRSEVNFHEQREQIMLGRFEEEIETIIETHPELKHKSEVNILATMGSYHTPLFHKFASEGIDTKRTFSHSPYIYDYGTQAIREIAFGREPNRDQLAKAYLSLILQKTLKDVVKDKIRSTEQKDLFVRDIVSQFNTDEVEYIHNQIVENRKLSSELIDEVFVKKGLNPLPSKKDKL